MDKLVESSVGQRKLSMILLGVFSTIALLLAAIGIYGVLSYSVGRRTREVGVRLALGATRGDVIRLVFRQGLGLTALGLAAGLAGALLLTRYLSSLLFEVSRWDVATYAAVAFLLLAVAVLACWIPARRAMRVDPVVALRFE
jgi:ABC-type antimicrobial peptide transport system permease subunit